MSHYQCILFDLDGTLANTFPGILHSYQYAAEKMGLQEPTEQIVNEAIGAPLKEVFHKQFGLNEKAVQEAILYYREQYANTGITEAACYPRIEMLLKELKAKGKQIGVTTLKNEDFAKRMLEHLGIAHYMDVIIGMDGEDKLTKSDLILKAVDLLKQDRKETVLVGDSFYDALGAQEARVDFIGVTYGFGFQKAEEIASYKGAVAVKSPMEILDKI